MSQLLREEERLKASIYSQYGGVEVLSTADVARPIPRRGEVLVRVYAAALNPKDILVRKGKFAALSGRHFPKIPGYDFAGVVAEVGPGVEDVSLGDEVFGMINAIRAGACAGFVAVPSDELAPKPPSLTMAEAAALPLVCLTALQAIRDLMKLEPGQRILINGASGGVGIHAVQIARLLGGVVTGVCSFRNTERVQEAGAAEVIDYTTQDPLALREPFDCFFDVFGNLPYAKASHLVKRPRGYVSVIPRSSTFANEAMARLGLPRPRLVVVWSRRDDLIQLTKWVEAGTLRPIIDRTYALEEMAEAHAYIETKRAQGKVVIEVCKR